MNAGRKISATSLWYCLLASIWVGVHSQVDEQTAVESCSGLGCLQAVQLYVSSEHPQSAMLHSVLLHYNCSKQCHVLAEQGLEDHARRFSKRSSAIGTSRTECSTFTNCNDAVDNSCIWSNNDQVAYHKSLEGTVPAVWSKTKDDCEKIPNCYTLGACSDIKGKSHCGWCLPSKRSFFVGPDMQPLSAPDSCRGQFVFDANACQPDMISDCTSLKSCKDIATSPRCGWCIIGTRGVGVVANGTFDGPLNDIMHCDQFYGKVSDCPQGSDGACAHTYKCTDISKIENGAKCAWCRNVNQAFRVNNGQYPGWVPCDANGWVSDASRCPTCDSITRCEEIGQAGRMCGWCVDSMSAMPGTQWGPSSGSCSKWIWEDTQCSDHIIADWSAMNNWCRGLTQCPVFETGWQELEDCLQNCPVTYGSLLSAHVPHQKCPCLARLIEGGTLNSTCIIRAMACVAKRNLMPCSEIKSCGDVFYSQCKWCPSLRSAIRRDQPCPNNERGLTSRKQCACEDLPHCGYMRDVPTCGWCLSNKRMFSGSVMGPSDTAACPDRSQWVFNYQSCPQDSFAQKCSDILACDHSWCMDKNELYSDTTGCTQVIQDPKRCPDWKSYVPYKPQYLVAEWSTVDWPLVAKLSRQLKRCEKVCDINAAVICARSCNTTVWHLFKRGTSAASDCGCFDDIFCKFFISSLLSKNSFAIVLKYKIF